MRSLINILNPYSVKEFLKKNWTSKAVYIASEADKKFENFFSWEKLTYLLKFHELHYPNLRLVLDGKVLDESDNINLTKLCQEGATLIVNKIHKLIPEIPTFTSEVKYDLGCGAQVNAYCSCPGRQGFSSHYDTHEVFIFSQGTETKFKSPKFQRARIVELSDGSGYKIIVSGKEVSLKGVDRSLIENLFAGEPFTGSDIMSWLPGFDWEIDIVPF